MFFLKKSSSFLRPLFPSFRFSTTPIPIDVRYSHVNYTNLVLALPHQNQKIFFINEKFTFQGLKEMFLLESPLSKINITYPDTLPLKDDSNLQTYFTSKESGVVQISIDGFEYVLSNAASFEMNKTVEKVLEEAENNRNNTLYWYHLLMLNKIPQTNLGTLAYFMKVLNHFVEKNGMENKLNAKDIEGLFKKALNEFACPINKKIEEFLEKNNEILSELRVLENTKKDIEENAKIRVVFYQKIIFAISLVQMISFYYMIFHVDWLGWDIIEPITYTITQITLLFGIRFFMKHGRKRDLGTMQEIFMKRIIGKNRPLREKYRSINQHLLEKRLEQQKIEWQIELLKNHRTYNQFMNQ